MLDLLLPFGEEAIKAFVSDVGSSCFTEEV